MGNVVATGWCSAQRWRTSHIDHASDTCDLLNCLTGTIGLFTSNYPYNGDGERASG